jgi:SNF2 family DNA or RNA helicase
MLNDNCKLPPFKPKHVPFEHQVEAFGLSKDLFRFALFMEMGTGKSKVTVDTFSHLFLDKQIDGVFITGYKSQYLNWMTDEIPAHLPDGLPYRISYWDANWTKKERAEAEKLLKPIDNVLDIFLMNIEALATERAEWFAMQFVKMHYTMAVVDESTCIKSHKAKRTKAMMRVGRMCDYRRILTGTPLTKGPLDIYAQAEFLEPGMLGFSGFLSFKNYFANVRRVEFGNRSYEKIDSYKNLDELIAKISTFSYRKLKSECLDLPEKIFMNHYVEHTPEQATWYAQLKEEAMIQFSEQSMVSSTSVLTTMMKLHQINCGHVIDDEGNMVHIPSNRIKALMELVELVDEKIIIWAHFKEDIKLIIQALAEEYGPQAGVHYYGGTNQEERALHLERFKRDPSCRFFVSNETGSKGLTLVQAPYAIYYSYSYNLETWLQSQDRNHRIGQTRNVTYTSLITPKTVDEPIIKSLKKKNDIAKLVLDDWRVML